jgi:hypothetical protein
MLFQVRLGPLGGTTSHGVVLIEIVQSGREPDRCRRSPAGAAFPVSNNGGVLNYYASRSLSDLLQDANLDLEHRNVHMHVPFGPPFPAVTCGAVERLN